MPWVNTQMCTGCGICIGECPVDAIESQGDGLAEINDDKCIRCGRCHDVCPQEAVRHDSERIPLEVADNLRWVRGLLGHFSDAQEQSAFMERMVRLFNKQKKVSEQTLAVIAAVEDKPADRLDTAIAELPDDPNGETPKG